MPKAEPNRDGELLPGALSLNGGKPSETCMIIDDFSNPGRLASNGATWELFTDQVMGGISRGTLTREIVADRSALRMCGSVSLENNGGFVQMSLDLNPNGTAFDASRYDGIEIDIFGNGERYNLHLRTMHTLRPWQSYRLSFPTHSKWQTVRLPFERFSAHRIDRALDLKSLRRISLVAIDRAFEADLSVSRVSFFDGS
jgi:hypothetical protein